MKHNLQDIDELRPEYQRSDFGEMVRGKYAGTLSEQTNVVILEPDVAQVFPNDKAVNDALRALLRMQQNRPWSRKPLASMKFEK
uniref:Uncharacterized protein n=1 Tax=Candidatus Kentrum eta TaxID=2126337 RepID=A0A450VCN4_9GAMM|nr:MAG: hypothetical protein BECKH772B_GA0070898_102874 [Candidatus Kentron sp. H]VFK02741.1 MAG: hypothetical protein BECKH772A_GA0070896_102844 [Candidatus Kentron sp. H]VFK06660.1 MAG: hypothetical protein BECKH772C_GA0070978_103661 [Candidatus Kentron sp. H]